MLAGDNSILQQTTNAKTRYSHSTVYESMQLEYSNYVSEKTLSNTSKSLIQYLQEKEIIGEETEDGWYVINTVKLMGSKQPYGNGTDGKTDVYVLEKKITEGMVEYKKVASTEPIKIAENAQTGSNETYKVVYHGKNTTDEVNLGMLVSNKIQSGKRTIKFYLSSTSSLPGYGYGSTSGSVSGSVSGATSGSNSGASTSNSIELEVEEGTTWLQWANDLSDEYNAYDVGRVGEYIRSLGENKTISGEFVSQYVGAGIFTIVLVGANSVNTSDKINEGEIYEYTVTWRANY